GLDSEIDVTGVAPGEPVEFDAWRWERLESIPALVVPYKRHVYERIVIAFAAFAAPASRS
ncbi:MAG: putative (di)nucleoside polyphosphate hydrolase, partial [Xanthobacteraceae bacterium]